MAVFLWAFPPENAIYLSLLQGIHDPDALSNGELVRKPLNELRSLRTWAQNVLEDWIEERVDLVPLRLADRGEHSPGRGYELGAIASIRYTGGAIPGDEQLLSDVVSFARALGELYRADASAFSSSSLSRPIRTRPLPPITSLPPAGIQIGTTVAARDLDSDERRSWTLVAKSAADPASGKLSIASPVGRALLGQDIGDTISVVTPGGTRRYLVEHRNQ